MKRTLDNNDDGCSSTSEQPHVKRIRSESKVEQNLHITDDMMLLISEKYIPINEWSQLMLVSRQFYNVTKLAYRSLKSLDIFDLFPRRYKKDWQNQDDKRFKNTHRLSQVLNGITSACPNLRKLFGFDCVSDCIESKHFVQLQALSNLTSVSFVQCRFSIMDFSDFLTNFANLQELEVTNCHWRRDKSAGSPDQILKSFETILGLKSLTLTCLESFTGKFLSFINTEKLESLNLGYSCFRITFLSDFLKRCTSLKTLVLYDPGKLKKTAYGLDNTVLQHLPTLGNLNSLTFIVKIYGHFLNYEPEDFANILGQCNNLRKLLIIDGEDLITNSNLLKTISLKCCSLQELKVGFQDCDVNAVNSLSNLKLLKSLSVNMGTFSNINALVSLLAFLENLTYLNLNVSARCCKDLHILSSMQQLRKLKLSDRYSNTNSSIIDDLLKRWGRETNFLQQLTSLQLDGLSVSDAGLTHVARNGRNLKKLKLNEVGNVTDDTFCLLAEHCKMLEMLFFYQKFLYHPRAPCQVTSRGLLLVLTSCRRLKIMLINSVLLKSLKKLVPSKSLVQLNYSDW